MPRPGTRSRDRSWVDLDLLADTANPPAQPVDGETNRDPRPPPHRSPDADPPVPTAPGGALLPLYTPAQAAGLLAVPESWLRRRVAARTVPCTFLGKHLRFSHTDLVAIAAAGARPAGPPTPPRRRRRGPRPAAPTRRR